MSILKQLLPAMAVSFVLTGSAYSAINYADSYKFTNKETWEVPEATLPPGDYVLTVHDKLLDREIFQVKGAKDGKVYSNFLAIHGKGGNAKTILTFWSGLENGKAIRAWFIPGQAETWDFVYPKERAIELAKASGSPVAAVDLSGLAKPNNPLLSAEDLRAVQLWLLTPKRVSPGAEGVQIAAAKIGPKHPRAAAASGDETHTMPRTSSHFVEMLGAGAMLAAAGLLVLRRARV